MDGGEESFNNRIRSPSSYMRTKLDDLMLERRDEETKKLLEDKGTDGRERQEGVTSVIILMLQPRELRSTLSIEIRQQSSSSGCNEIRITYVSVPIESAKTL